MGLWVYGCHWTGFQETVIVLEVWEELEASGFHQLYHLPYGGAEPEGRGEEEGWVHKPDGEPVLADWHLHDD